MLFTSGSSGAPKGVLHTQATLAYKAALMADVHDMRANDCVLMPAPRAHISGLLNGVTLPGVVPFRTVFMSKWDPEHALELIESKRVTYMIGPPTFFVSLMQASGFTRAAAAPDLVGRRGASRAFVEERRRRSAVIKHVRSTEAPSAVTSGGPTPQTRPGARRP